MATIVNFEDRVEVPLNLQSLDGFRRWCFSDSFPERGRIDFVNARIEVDMSPEDLFTHGSPKVEIIHGLRSRVKHGSPGRLFADRTRVTHSVANLSAEPDVVFVSRATLAGPAVRLVPRATPELGRFIEIEGAPDLVVEIVSDTSETKDTLRLPGAYFAAGIREFWLVDARGKELVFCIHSRGPTSYEAVAIDADGCQRSAVFGCRFKLQRFAGPDSYWDYDLLVREAE